MVVVYYGLGENIVIVSGSPWMLSVSRALKVAELWSVVVGYGDSH